VDPIYAYFYVDERSVLNYEQQVREGKLPDARSGAEPVYLQLENETGFPHQGNIDFRSNQFNSSTGTFPPVRCTVPVQSLPNFCCIPFPITAADSLFVKAISTDVI